MPAYNEVRNIGQLLSFLYETRLEIGRLTEVLVEASGSTDGTSDVVRQWEKAWPIVRIIDGPRRLGLVAALSNLIQQASGDLVIRLDADVIPGQGTLGRLLAAFTDPSVGIASPRVSALPSSSTLATLASRAEWEVHHEVSLAVPKTTLVQVFRRSGVVLAPDAILEDAALQVAVERAGFRAIYLPEVMVSVCAPASIPAFLAQRVRTVRIIRSYLNRGSPLPATASRPVIVAALVAVLRNRSAPLRGLILFAMIETAARAVSLLLPLGKNEPSPIWEPIDGTKAPAWSRSDDPPERGR